MRELYTGAEVIERKNPLARSLYPSTFMTASNSTDLSIAAAQAMLKQFSCLETKLLSSPAEKIQLQQSLLLIASLSEYQNFGVCADSVAEGLTALTSYWQAFGYQTPLDTANLPKMEGAVYIKLNSKKGSLYFDSYFGQYRGVLVSCQSSSSEEINGTYGHLPLDLFS